MLCVGMPRKKICRHKYYWSPCMHSSMHIIVNLLKNLFSRMGPKGFWTKKKEKKLGLTRAIASYASFSLIRGRQGIAIMWWPSTAPLYPGKNFFRYASFLASLLIRRDFRTGLCTTTRLVEAEVDCRRYFFSCLIFHGARILYKQLATVLVSGSWFHSTIFFLLLFYFCLLLYKLFVLLLAPCKLAY